VSLDRLAIVGVVVLAVILAFAAQAGLLDRPVAALVGNLEQIDTPALDDPAMIRRGAAHYDRVCAACHASPDRPEQDQALDLSPPAPKLHERVDGRAPVTLFRTVKHGVRGSGMPAWPAAQRDDEIWSMVAFLRVLPNLDAATYRALAGRDAANQSLSALLANCANCHGTDGRGSDGAFPRLDIQSPEYLYATLIAFRDGSRASGFMQSAVSGLSDNDLQLLAQHYGNSAKVVAAEQGPPSFSEQGTSTGNRPACAACHGPPTPARPEMPNLSGQYEGYLLRQLELFIASPSARGGGPFAVLMHEAARSLTSADAQELARWYATGADRSPPRS
jgi:cytochrome c553/cytochrome c5